MVVEYRVPSEFIPLQSKNYKEILPLCPVVKNPDNFIITFGSLLSNSLKGVPINFST